ncbi:molybdate ABC transporter substrate-binding protein [Deferribacter autotrophicus]|uniref:Molybdate ABC transporter substrate-binding protein n=1 Tax=Deferribacter autotrophicus TaxID=500465 RepID=A0A5A8F962_9BACT|nr:molybdate ABC transporter substrate-binding protein [Deferribacter autotrophicus]KAA0259512.1 molybdate ABC transporter substrate-binding protein [Deferribacter autotrophicus]
MIKKIIFMILVLPSLVFSYDIYFYVAASMTKPAKEVVQKFNIQSKDDQVILITGGSGQLLNKIVFSKKGDIYLPASKSFKEKAEKAGIVLETTNFLYQTPVFGLSKSGENKIKSFEDLAFKKVRIALGNPKTMALGRIYENIKAKMPENLVSGIDKNMAVLAVNVSQIVNYLKTNSVDAGIIFDSVARVNDFKYINFPDGYAVKDVASINLLKFSKNVDKTKSFISFLIKNKDIFKKYGFEVIEK